MLWDRLAVSIANFNPQRTNIGNAKVAGMTDDLGMN